MKVTIIVAKDPNNLIGIDGRLPWHIPSDLKFFKEITMDKPIVMGRKTFESLPKMLPRRKHIVLTRNNDWGHDNVETFYNLEDFSRRYSRTNHEFFIIGGSEIYKLFLPIADKIIFSLVHKTYSGDTYFPSIDYSDWKVVFFDTREHFNVQILNRKR